jgi:hypothetical protein
MGHWITRCRPSACLYIITTNNSLKRVDSDHEVLIVCLIGTNNCVGRVAYREVLRVCLFTHHYYKQ